VAALPTMGAVRIGVLTAVTGGELGDVSKSR